MFQRIYDWLNGSGVEAGKRPRHKKRGDEPPFDLNRYHFELESG